MQVKEEISNSGKSFLARMCMGSTPIDTVKQQKLLAVIKYVSSLNDNLIENYIDELYLKCLTINLDEKESRRAQILEDCDIPETKIRKLIKEEGRMSDAEIAAQNSSLEFKILRQKPKKHPKSDLWEAVLIVKCKKCWKYLFLGQVSRGSNHSDANTGLIPIAINIDQTFRFF